MHVPLITDLLYELHDNNFTTSLMLKHCVVYIACLIVPLSTIPRNLILTPTTLCHNLATSCTGSFGDFEFLLFATAIVVDDISKKRSKLATVRVLFVQFLQIEHATCLVLKIQ